MIPACVHPVMHRLGLLGERPAAVRFGLWRRLPDQGKHIWAIEVIECRIVEVLVCIGIPGLRPARRPAHPADAVGGGRGVRRPNTVPVHGGVLAVVPRRVDDARLVRGGRRPARALLRRDAQRPSACCCFPGLSADMRSIHAQSDLLAAKRLLLCFKSYCHVTIFAHMPSTAMSGSGVNAMPNIVNSCSLPYA